MNLNVKIARIRKGLTQKQLREKLINDYSIGMSPNAIVAIEKGNFSILKYDAMIAIASALDENPQELFFKE